MTILIFLLVLFVLILVHELGHFIVAKKTGMRVDEFGIGFPPKLFGVRIGETEYTLNLFPIGGFVKIYGEDAVNVDGTNTKRAFVGKPKLSQAAVLIAGVTANVLLAWLLFTIAFTAGVRSVVSEAEAGPGAQPIITEVVPGSPADNAGLIIGAEVVKISSSDSSLDVVSPSSFSAFVTEHVSEELTVTYLVGEHKESAVLRAQHGVIKEEPQRMAIGVALSFVGVVSKPVHVALYEGLVFTFTGLRDITVGIGTLLYDSVRLQADLSTVAGPVGIVNLVGEASSFGFTTLIMFTAFISLNLAIINLLPFPALDGGRLLFVLIEAVKGSRIHPQLASTLNMVGFALLILLMLAITYNDIVKII